MVYLEKMDVKAPTPLAILGHPVGHSLSPLIHNTALAALGMGPGYVACDVAPEYLPHAVKGLVALGFRGANVTLPYKSAVLPLMDKLSPAAAAIGAVNTIIVDGDHLTGDNTDHIGFAQPLRPHARRLSGGRAVILGAGGAARGVLFALQQHFDLDVITVVSRRETQARSLVEDLRGTASIASWDHVDALCCEAQLLVNTTPLGMTGAPSRSPVGPSGLGPHQIVYDLVYTPADTPLLKLAESAGAHRIGGLPMLLGQAAASFFLWTGLEMPKQPVNDAVTLALAHADAS